jgi:hypothetical protein
LQRLELDNQQLAALPKRLGQHADLFGHCCCGGLTTIRWQRGCWPEKCTIV